VEKILGVGVKGGAPQAGASPLGPAGPGFAVVRSWLAPSEVEALRAYAAEVPCFPASEAFHTFERNGEGAVVPSRTEHFAHIEDAGGVGAFLREGRLRELCSALREGRPFALYKGGLRRAVGRAAHASPSHTLSLPFPPTHSHFSTPLLSRSVARREDQLQAQGQHWGLQAARGLLLKDQQRDAAARVPVG
jgi:hypothetical protein